MPAATEPQPAHNSLSRRSAHRNPAAVLEATVRSNLKRKLANRCRDFYCSQTGLRETIPGTPQPKLNRLENRVSQLTRKVNRALSVPPGPKNRPDARANWTTNPKGLRPTSCFINPTFDSRASSGINTLSPSATRAPWGEKSCAETRIKPWKHGSPLLTQHEGRTPWQVRKEENLYRTQPCAAAAPLPTQSEADSEMQFLQTRISELEGGFTPAGGTSASRPTGPEYAPQSMLAGSTRPAGGHAVAGGRQSFGPRHTADTGQNIPGYWNSQPVGAMPTGRSSLASSRYSPQATGRSTGRSSLASSQAPTLYGVNIQSTEWERPDVSMVHHEHRGQGTMDGDVAAMLQQQQW